MFNFNSSPLIRDTLNAMTQLQQRCRVLAYYPTTETECTETGCGHDAVMNSRKKPDCTVCDARGYITTWTTQHINGRVVRPEQISFDFRENAVVVETADLNLYISITDLDTIKRIKGNERAYLLVEGEYYRPYEITAMGVTGLDEYLVSCSKHKPR